MTASRPSQAGGDSGHQGGEQGTGPAHPRRSWHERDFGFAVPEALASPAILWVRHADVLGDPYNIRDSLPSIPRLAWSIYQYGLLENLLVVEVPPDRALSTGKKFELRAGSRRFEAIRRLIEEGVQPPPGHVDREHGITWRWPADKLISVLVLGSEGHNEHLIENVERCEPLPWEIGRRVNEALGSGLSTRDLGIRLGRSGGWVTRYAHLGRGLAPELIEVLRKERADVKLGELAQLAAIRDRFDDPDGPGQIEEYRKRRLKRRRRPRRIDPHTMRATIKRMQYLRGDMPVPGILRPIVTAVIDYLEGGENPRFRELETHLLEKVKAFSPNNDIEDL